MAKEINEIVFWLTAGLIVGLLAFASSGFPQLRFILSLVWAAPAAYIVYRYGLHQGIRSVLVAGILVGFLAGAVEAGSLILEIGPLAIAIGLLYKNRVAPARAMIICIIVAAAARLIEFGITYGQLSAAWQQMQKGFSVGIDQFIAEYKKSGSLDQAFPGFTEAEIRAGMLQSLQEIFKLLPGISVVNATIVALTNYRFAHRYFARGGIALPPVLPFVEWNFPWYIIWLAILGLVGVLLGQPDSMILLIGKNLLVVSGFLSALLGISVVGFYLRRSALPQILKGFLVIFLILNGVFSLAFVMIIGLLDPIINLRRLGVKTE